MDQATKSETDRTHSAVNHFADSSVELSRGAHEHFRPLKWSANPREVPADSLDLDARALYEFGAKLQAFSGAALTHACNPDSYKQYIVEERDKLIGIGDGLNEAKEQTKASAANAWNALTDGTVMKLLAVPNVFNDPLCHATSAIVDAMAHDPHAVEAAVAGTLERVANGVLDANGKYSILPDREKGRVIGNLAFALVNPEGSPKSGEAALKIANTLAGRVDDAVINIVRRSIEAAGKASPDVAYQIKSSLYEHLRDLKLTPAEYEYAGVPRHYFEGVSAAKDDGFFAMSKQNEGENLGARIHGNGDCTNIKWQIDESTGRLQRTDLGPLRQPYKWPVLNEVFAPDAIRQSVNGSCVSASGSMLCEDGKTEADFMAALGVPGDILDLPKVLGSGWTSAPGPTTLAELGKNGPWAAEMREGHWTKFPKEPHVVIVDGPSPLGNVIIRDPLEGTRYEMTVQNFNKTWTGQCAYRM